MVSEWAKIQQAHTAQREGRALNECQFSFLFKPPNWCSMLSCHFGMQIQNAPNPVTTARMYLLSRVSWLSGPQPPLTLDNFNIEQKSQGGLSEIIVVVVLVIFVVIVILFPTSPSSPSSAWTCQTANEKQLFSTVQRTNGLAGAWLLLT